MGLRDYLASLQVGAEGAQQFADTAQKLRTQNELRSIAAQTPALLDAGNINEIAGQYASVGQMGPLNDVMAANLAAQKATAKAKLEPVADAAFLAGIEKQGEMTPGSMSYLIGAPRDEVYKAAGVGQKTQIINNAERSIGIREGLVNYNKYKDVNAVFKPLDKEFDEDKQALAKVDAAYKTNSLPGDAVVLNFIARKMADEKGPLADQDIKRLQGDTWEKRYQEAKNFLSGAAKATQSDPARAQALQLLKLARTTYESGVEEKLRSAITGVVTTDTEFMSDPKKVEAMNTRVKRRGYEGFEINDAGIATLIKGKKTVPVDPIDPETGAPDPKKLKQIIDAISDPALKANALRGYDSMMKKNPDSATLNNYYKILQKNMGQ